MESAIRDVAISPCCLPPLPASSPDDRRSTAAAAARSGPGVGIAWQLDSMAEATLW